MSRGLYRGEHFVVEPKLLQTADLEVLDDDIGGFRKSNDDLAPGRRAEIHCDRFLAAVGAEVVGTENVGFVLDGHERRSPASGIIARARPLYLDDLCAQVGQQLRRPGAGKNPGKIENAKSGQASIHACPAGTPERCQWRWGEGALGRCARSD